MTFEVTMRKITISDWSFEMNTERMSKNYINTISEMFKKNNTELGSETYPKQGQKERTHDILIVVRWQNIRDGGKS